MKRIKYWLLLTFIIIIIGIGFKFLIPNGENNIDKINDNVVHIKNTTYQVKSIKAITSENYFTSPTFSPDGKKLAITNLNYKGLYIENINDGTQKKISDDEGAGFRFSWSPDSKEIVYLSRRLKNGAADFSIKIVEIETGKIIDLTAGGIGASMPTFSKTNGIMYSYKGTLMMRKGTIDIKTNKKSFKLVEVVAENIPANIIMQSPSGQKLIIEDDEGIKIMDSNGENRKTIIKNGEKDFACDSKVSLEGNKVMFVNNVGAIEHLYVYNIDSEKITDLGEGYMGQWLPDDRIIYCITINDGNVNTASELYMINSDGTNKVKITDTPDQIEIQPTISPDGKSIAYRDEKSGRIYLGFLLEKSNKK